MRKSNMKIEKQQRGWAIKGLSDTEMLIIDYIIQGVSDKCYKDIEDGIAYSGDDYIGSMSENQAEVLRGLSAKMEHYAGHYLKY